MLSTEKLSFSNLMKLNFSALPLSDLKKDFNSLLGKGYQT
jgi:hypothetical protein